MERYINLFLALIVCVLLVMYTQVGFAQDGDNLYGPKNEVMPMIALTRLKVTDKVLELDYKIKNRSDHDIWICKSLDIYRNWLFDVFLTDDQTLLIRRRFDIPAHVLWSQLPSARYVRLLPGEERTESLSLVIPLIHNIRSLFADYPEITTEYVKRLVLEIGFYNEDLPGMIRGILAVAEKIKSAGIDLLKENPDITLLYFKGSWLDHYFGGLSSFNEANKNENDGIEIPYHEQILMGEQVLRVTVDGVYISYEEVQAADATAKVNEGKLSKSDKPNSKTGT